APLPARRARRYAGARRSPFRWRRHGQRRGRRRLRRSSTRGAEDVPTGVSEVLLTCVAADGRGRRRELVVVEARWPGERRRQVTVGRNLRVFFSSAEGQARVRPRAGVHGGEQVEDGVEVTRGVDLGGQLTPLLRGKLPKHAGAGDGVEV
ncbi:unnamed protein product, partial [Ectocarpus sp. 12 AP-2014]